jgi:hypothetical protein
MELINQLLNISEGDDLEAETVIKLKYWKALCVIQEFMPVG